MKKAICRKVVSDLAIKFLLAWIGKIFTVRTFLFGLGDPRIFKICISGPVSRRKQVDFGNQASAERSRWALIAPM